jgi:hypothetical protein
MLGFRNEFRRGVSCILDIDTISQRNDSPTCLMLAKSAIRKLDAMKKTKTTQDSKRKQKRIV